MSKQQPIRAILFDLDGTLLNTLYSLAACFNRVLEAEGYPIHPTDAFKQFIGDGARVTVERCLPTSEQNASTINRLLVKQQIDYAEHWQEHVTLYPGIDALLSRLKTIGIPMGVLSNKDHPFVCQCTAHFFPGLVFAGVQGFDQGVPHKPDPTGALKLTEKLALNPGNILLVGDTAVDIQTARAAGMQSVGVLWGFRDRYELENAGADFIVNEPFEILELPGLLR